MEGTLKIYHSDEFKQLNLDLKNNSIDELMFTGSDRCKYRIINRQQDFHVFIDGRGPFTFVSQDISNFLVSLTLMDASPTMFGKLRNGVIYKGIIYLKGEGPPALPGR